MKIWDSVYLKLEYTPVEQKRHKKHENDYWRLLGTLMVNATQKRDTDNNVFCKQAFSIQIPTVDWSQNSIRPNTEIPKCWNFYILVFNWNYSSEKVHY